MPIKLIAFDIDGTLVPEHTNNISHRVASAIKQAKEKTAIVLVSARALKDQELIINALALQGGYHVIENGTKVLSPSGEIAYTLFLPQQEVMKLQEVGQEYCESIGYCVDGKWLQGYPESIEDCVTTLSLITPKVKSDALVTKIGELNFSHCITVGNHWNNPDHSVVLISHKNASKGGGLRYVQQKLGISLEETIAVGDGASDVPMMQYAAIKVAMGNAEQKLKDMATHTVGSVLEDGAAEVIEKFILDVTAEK